MDARPTKAPDLPAGPRQALFDLGRWAAVASLFAVPINKPLTSAALALALICSLSAPRLGSRLHNAWREPVVRGALLWMAVLSLSALHAVLARGSEFPKGSTLWALTYPLIIATLFDSDRWRRRAVLAFCAAVTLVLLISWGQALGWVPQRDIVQMQTGTRFRNTVFKEYNQQGVAFLILASFAFAWFIRTGSRRLRLLLALIVLLAVGNVLFLIDSRAALLALLLLMAYFAWSLLAARRGPGWRQWLLLLTGLAVVGAVLWGLPSTRERFRAIKHEAELYDARRVATPAGARLEMWRRTLPMIASAPWFGHGLNQWAPMYRDAIRELPDYEAFRFDHPHQEYLWILAEEGIVGLLIFTALMIALWRRFSRLPPAARDAWSGLMVIYLVVGLSHCLWFDFAHRHAFILLLACMPRGLESGSVPDAPGQHASYDERDPSAKT